MPGNNCTYTKNQREFTVQGEKIRFPPHRRETFSFELSPAFTLAGSGCKHKSIQLRVIPNQPTTVKLWSLKYRVPQIFWSTWCDYPGGMWRSSSWTSSTTRSLTCCAVGTVTTGSPRGRSRAPATAASESTARWTRSSGRPARPSDFLPSFSTPSSQVNLHYGSTRRRCPTESVRTAASACCTNTRRECRTPGDQRLTTKTPPTKTPRRRAQRSRWRPHPQSPARRQCLTSGSPCP